MSITVNNYVLPISTSLVPVDADVWQYTLFQPKLCFIALYSSVCTLSKAQVHQFLIDSWNKHFINNNTCDYKAESISSVYFFESTSTDADDQRCDSYYYWKNNGVSFIEIAGVIIK